MGLASAVLLGFYAILAATGVAKRGEMAHYRRERKIERDWKRNMEKITEK